MGRGSRRDVRRRGKATDDPRGFGVWEPEAPWDSEKVSEAAFSALSLGCVWVWVCADQVSSTLKFDVKLVSVA